MFKVSRKSEVAKICLKLGLFLIGIIISKTDPKLGLLSAKCRVGWRYRKGTTDLKSKTTCAKVECRTMCRVGWWFSTGTQQFRKVKISVEERRQLIGHWIVRIRTLLMTVARG